MCKSTRYKIVVWLVWVQIALMPISILLIIIPGADRIWRWDIPFWTLSIGYVLGLVLLPLSYGVEKDKSLKWWLRIDFVLSILIFVPFGLILLCSRPTVLSTKGDYVLYRYGGFMASPRIIFGAKSGPFITELENLSVSTWDISDYDWDIDSRTGCFWINSSDSNYKELHVCPADSMLYHANKEMINERIDSLYHLYADTYNSMDFVLPDDFSRISYTGSDFVDYYHAGSQWWDASVMIRYHKSENNLSTDSVTIRLEDYGEKMVYPKDSIPHMSPSGIHSFIIRLENQPPIKR